MTSSPSALLNASAADLYDLIQWTETDLIHDLKMIAVGLVIGSILTGIAIWKN